MNKQQPVSLIKTSHTSLKLWLPFINVIWTFTGRSLRAASRKWENRNEVSNGCHHETNKPSYNAPVSALAPTNMFFATLLKVQTSAREANVKIGTNGPTFEKLYTCFRRRCRNATNGHGFRQWRLNLGA